MTTTEFPIIDAYRDGNHLVFWCEHCRREHTHGVCSGDSTCPIMRTPIGKGTCTCPPGSGDGHRVAHCHSKDSPYYRGGYILREVPTSGDTP